MRALKPNAPEGCVQEQLSNGVPTPLKTVAGRRQLPLLDEAVKALEVLEAGVTDDSALLFVGDRGGSVNPDFFRSREFRGILVRAGLADRGYSPHTMRSVAAALLAPHVGRLGLCQAFGWRNLQTAAQYYNRPSRATVERARTGLSKAFEAVRTS